MRHVQFRFGLVGLLLVIAGGCSTAVQTTAVSTDTAESADSGAVPSETSLAEPGDEGTSDSELIIDVRSQEEWDAGHVEQAIHIPHTEIAEKIFQFTSDKNAKITVYCAVGGRAGKAKEALEKIGFTNVENAGGFEDIKKRLE